jgi:hypothetical protein
MTRRTESDAPARVCATCDREIEDCSFCGEPNCPAPECYSDMVTALRAGMLQPHTHGG